MLKAWGGAVEGVQLNGWQVAAELVAQFTVKHFDKPSLRDPFHAACRHALGCVDLQDQGTAADLAAAIIYFVTSNLTGDATVEEVASWAGVDVARVNACFDECVHEHSDAIIGKLWG